MTSLGRPHTGRDAQALEVGIAMRFVCGFGRFGKEMRSILVDFVGQLQSQCRVVRTYE